MSMKFSEILEGGRPGTISLRPGRRTWGKSPQEWVDRCRSEAVWTDRNAFLHAIAEYYPDNRTIPAPSIGADSFNLYTDAAGNRRRCPSIGDLAVGLNVTMNPGVIICRGLVGTTRIGNNVHIDGNVYIGHDCQIGDDVTIILNAGLAGYVRVDSGAWIGPGATICRRVHIGENAFIAAGAVVMTDVPPNARVIGNPARETLNEWSRK